MAKSEEELKSLDESERREWKSWLKAQHSENEDHGIRSHHFMANRWGNSENSDRLDFERAPKSLKMVTTAMKLRCLLLGREAMINLDSVLKSRNVTFPAKVCLVKAMVFSVVTYRCGSLTIMKAESWRMNVLNCVGEESWECPGLQRDQTSQS